jgi:hypothetical protein
LKRRAKSEGQLGGKDQSQSRQQENAASHPDPVLDDSRQKAGDDDDSKFRICHGNPVGREAGATVSGLYA